MKRATRACVIGAVLFAGCGGDEESSPPSTTPAATEAPATESTSTEVTVSTDVAVTADTSASSAPTTDAAPATTVDPDACREIEHVLGTTCVPADPRRIVSLDALMVLPTLLEVGVTPIGSVSVYGVGEPFQDYLDPATVADIETVGSLQTPNIEKIAALEPDLIIGNELVVGPILDQLEQIAPTVATRYAFYVSDWLEDARLVADAVGRGDDYEEVIDELAARTAEVADELATRGAPLTLTRVDMFAGTPLYFRFGCVWYGSLMSAVGLTQPEGQQPDACTPGDYQSVIQYPSLEQLDVLEADLIVAYQQQAAEGDVGTNPLEALEATPLWSTLSAVQNDRVFVLGDAWGLGVSVTAALQILDDLVETVLPV